MKILVSLKFKYAKIEDENKNEIEKIRFEHDIKDQTLISFHKCPAKE